MAWPILREVEFTCSWFADQQDTTSTQTFLTDMAPALQCYQVNCMELELNRSDPPTSRDCGAVLANTDRNVRPYFVAPMHGPLPAPSLERDPDAISDEDMNTASSSTAGSQTAEVAPILSSSTAAEPCQILTMPMMLASRRRGKLLESQRKSRKLTRQVGACEYCRTHKERVS